FTASDDIWSSTKDPASLVLDYARAKDAGDGVLLWVGRLIEILVDVFRLANLPPPILEQLGNIEAQEDALEYRLREWYRALPSSLWVSLGDDFSLMSDKEGGAGASTIKSDGALSAFFLFHGAVSLLMRRRFMRFLRYFSARLYQHLWDTSVSSSSPQQLPPPLLPPQSDERAFKAALEAARAMASCIRALRLSNAFLHRLPDVFVFMTLQSLLTLVAVEGLPITGLDSPVVPELSPLASSLDASSGISLRLSEQPPEITTARATDTGNAPAIDDIDDDGVSTTSFRPLDELFFLYRRMSATKQLVGVLLQIIEALRGGTLHITPATAPTTATAAAATAAAASTFPSGQAPVTGCSGSAAFDIDPDRLLSLANRAPLSLRRWHHSRVASRSAVREYFRSLAEARDVAAGLAPLFATASLLSSSSSSSSSPPPPPAPDYAPAATAGIDALPAFPPAGGPPSCGEHAQSPPPSSSPLLGPSLQLDVPDLDAESRLLLDWLLDSGDEDGQN
ncbi:hypothetical protein HK405_004544, partial [Cladochytrium tenue]